jgi:hypothetical protein
MDRQSRRLERIRIASPCSVGWERMVGDDRVRFCHQCNLNVYNISRMTAGQVEALIDQTEGRFCARLYRRADGTILTRDCPVGLRAIRRRVSRIGGAAITAMMSFCLSVFGQNPSTKVCTRDSDSLPIKIKRERAASQSQDGYAVLSGKVFDPQGAVVPGAKLTLINEESKEERMMEATDEGDFQFTSVVAGSYTLKVETPGFKIAVVQYIKVGSNESLLVNATLEVKGGETVMVGIVGINSNSIDLSSTSVTTTINVDEARSSIPIP